MKRISTLVTAAILINLSPASPQDAAIYLAAPLFERTGPPFSARVPDHGLTESLYGPIPLGVAGERIAVLDVGRSDQPDLVVAAGSVLTWFDLGGGAPRRLPRAPAAIEAMVAIDAVGGPRDDLVIAGEDALWAMDLDVLPRRWTRLFPVAFEVTSLAAADVVGGPQLDLVASDGRRLRARETGPASQWSFLPDPPSPPEVISAAFLGTGGEFFTTSSSDRVLVATFQQRSFFWRGVPSGGTWTGPLLRRTRTVSAAPFNIRHPSEPPLGQVILAAPLPARRRATEITFEHITAAAGLDSPLEPAGDSHCPGAVFADLDGDDMPDLYLPRGHSPGVTHGGENLLYFGDGQGGFEAAPPGHGAEDRSNSSGALALDYDNDGDLDLYVLNSNAPNLLLQNRGGRFSDVTATTDPTPADPADDDQDGLGWGLTRVGCDGSSPCRLQETLAAAAGDVNRDGLIDVYMGNHRCCGGPRGIRDVLYLNNGAGADGRVTFTDVTISAGITREDASIRERSTQAVLIADLDGDLWPDIYVSNKGDGPGEDQLFLNRGDTDGDGTWDGGFSETLQARPGTPGGVTWSAMAVAAGDYDGDGDLDLFLTDIGDADLLRNRLVEDGRFALEVVRSHPLRSPDWTWGASWTDFDNDGDLDLHVTSHFGLMDHLHLNRGGGRFTEIASAVGIGGAWDSRATVPADLDRDGRTDLLVLHRGDTPPSLYRNRTSNGAHWLRVELVGAPELPGRFASTRRAVGARVVLTTAGRSQRRDLLLGDLSCGSTRESVLAFGVGSARSVQRLEVFWPSGRVSTLRRLAVDRKITIRESDAP